MWQAIKDFVYKITRSSTNPEKMALTFKGAIVAIVPILISLVPIFCASHIGCVDPNSISSFADTLVSLVQNLTATISGFMIVFGLLRKVYNGVWNHPLAGV